MRNDFKWNEIKRIVRAATALVAKNDAHLLTFRANERAVVHRLAHYLEPVFADWHIDCEYNRQGGKNKPKTVRIAGTKRNVVPDVIVHLPGPWDPELENNLLAIEVKPWWASKTKVALDYRKLRRYVVEHHYQFAAFVSYERDGEFDVERVVPGA